MSDEQLSQPRQRSFTREPAKRVFASELRESRLQFKDGEDEYSPTYVLLPTGERCNRIFISGRLTQKEKRGDQHTYYTARIQDPTGTFFANIWDRDSDAWHQIQRIDPEAYVAVTGKPTIRSSQDGSTFVSVRIESVIRIEMDDYRNWVLDVARQTLDRLDRFGQTDDSRNAGKFYTTDPAIYRQMVYNALVQMRI
jgi:RPA family protein